MSLDLLRQQFQFIRSLPHPVLQQLFATASPIQFVVTVSAADFGTSVPVRISARIYLQGLGQGLPQVPMTLAVNGQSLGNTPTFSDDKGQVAFNTQLDREGTYSFRVFVGPVDPNNPVYSETSMTIARVRVDSSLSNVPFVVNGRAYSTPANLLFPFFAGSQGYTMAFPPIVVLGTNNAWLLQAPQSYTVVRSDSFSLPYVRPNLACTASPSTVLVGSNVAYSVIVKDDAGNPIPYLGVALEDSKTGRVLASLTTDGNGAASYTTSFGEGTYSFLGSWQDLNFSQPATVTVVMPSLSISAPGNVLAGQSFNYGVRSTARTGGQAIGNLPISVYVDGQFVKNATTDANGFFSDALSFAMAGTHQLMVQWGNLVKQVLQIVAAVPAPSVPVGPSGSPSAPTLSTTPPATLGGAPALVYDSVGRPVTSTPSGQGPIVDGAVIQWTNIAGFYTAAGANTTGFTPTQFAQLFNYLVQQRQTYGDQVFKLTDFRNLVQWAVWALQTRKAQWQAAMQQPLQAAYDDSYGYYTFSPLSAYFPGALGVDKSSLYILYNGSDIAPGVQVPANAIGNVELRPYMTAADQATVTLSQLFYSVT